MGVGRMIVWLIVAYATSFKREIKTRGPILSPMVVLEGRSLTLLRSRPYDPHHTELGNFSAPSSNNRVIERRYPCPNQLSSR